MKPLSVIFLLVLVGISTGNPKQQKKQQEPEKSRSYNDTTYVGSPVQVEILSKESESEKRRAAKLDSERLKYDSVAAYSNKDMVTPSILAAVFAGLGFLVSLGTFLFIRWQARRELRAYVHPTTKIKNVEELNELAKYDSGNWADISITAEHFASLTNPPKALVYRITFKNYGKTPAHNISADGSVYVRPYPLSSLDATKEFPPLVKRKDILPSKKSDEIIMDGTLGPTQKMVIPIGFDEPISQEDIERIILGKEWAIYVYGHIEYDDAFGTYHVTNFCFSHRKTEKTGKYGDILEAWINSNEAT